MKRFTLIIDGHNFFFRSLWSTFKTPKSGNKVLSTNKDVDDYEKEMMLDFCNLCKNISGVVNDIVFIKDSHSWRKDLLLQQEYKGNRKKAQDKINKNGFNTAISNFTNTLSEYGIKVSSAENSEGDDLIFQWTTNLFENGKSSIIFSTDKDLTQLVKCEDDVHVIQLSPISNTLYISENTSKQIDKIKSKKEVSLKNLFNEDFSISIDNDAFDNFINDKNKTIVIVNPEEIRFTKIIGGDSSDNIFPVYWKKATETTKSKGIGEKTVEKIMKAFVDKLGGELDYHIYTNEKILKVLADIIYDCAKIDDDKFTKDMLIDNIKTNAILVSLTEESIPQYVQENMKANILVESEKKQAIVSKISKETIFAKSRFKDYKNTIQIKSNTLKGVRDNDDMSWIKD